MILRVKEDVSIIQKNNYTYKDIYRGHAAGKIASIPELLQRILPKDVWTEIVANAYFRGNFVFTGGAILQTFVFITKKALLDSLQHDYNIALDNANAEFIQEAIDIIENNYPDAEWFIIDGQSRNCLALIPLFENKIQYKGTITFDDGTFHSNFFWSELNDAERDAILNQKVTANVIEKGSLKNAAQLVIGLNTNNPFSQSGKNWLVWFTEQKFIIARDIIHYFGIPAVFSPKWIKEDSAKYKFSQAGHIAFLFDVIHLIKNINEEHNYKVPDPGMVHTTLLNSTSYMKKLHLDDDEMSLLKIFFGSLADIQLTKDIKIPKYANALNLIIRYNYLFNPMFRKGQLLLEEVFTSFTPHVSRIKVKDRKTFAQLMIRHEIECMQLNEFELDSKGKVKKDPVTKKSIVDREGMKYIMQSTSDTNKMIKRFALIATSLKPFLHELRDKGVIEIIQKREKVNWYDVYNKTKGTQEDIYGNPLSDIHYLENQEDYDIGHILSNDSGGSETLENKELEKKNKNRKKKARNY